MNRKHRTPGLARGAALLLTILGSALVAARVHGDVGDDTHPTAKPPSLLEQLNHETERLYADVGHSLFRVQLPTPRSVSAPAGEESPLTKYKELDPKVRRELEQRRPHAPPAGGGAEGEPLARGDAAGPAATSRSASDADLRFNPGAAVIVVAPPAPPAAAGAARPDFSPNNIGLLLDERGHVLVPQWVDPEAAAAEPVHLRGPDGGVTAARLVGSDRQTNLSVLELPQPTAAPLRPVRLEDEPPRDGSLVLLVSPGDASGRLDLWTGGRESGVVFSIGGGCAGVSRPGQFLGGRACRLIAEQIIRHGSVRRATLGVIITEIRKDDPLRRRSPPLGDRTAVRVDQVMPGSAAEKAGLQPGDVLVALAGEAVNDIPSLAAAIAARTGPTELQLVRGAEVVKLTVDLQQK